MENIRKLEIVMEYNLIVDNEKKKLKVDVGEKNTFNAIIGEKKFNVAYEKISHELIRLRINGKEINAHIEYKADSKNLIIKGNAYSAQDADEFAQKRKKKKNKEEASGIITPPMPAVVISVMAKKGDTVKKGAGLVAVSAMKMETTLTAPFDCTIEKVNVAEGDKVMPGDVLIDIFRQ